MTEDARALGAVDGGINSAASYGDMAGGAGSGPMTNQFASLSSGYFGGQDIDSRDYALAIERARQLRRERGDSITQAALRNARGDLTQRGMQTFDYGDATNRDDAPFGIGQGTGIYRGIAASPQYRLLAAAQYGSQGDDAGMDLARYYADTGVDRIGGTDVNAPRSRAFHRALQAGNRVYGNQGTPIPKGGRGAGNSTSDNRRKGR